MAPTIGTIDRLPTIWRRGRSQGAEPPGGRPAPAGPPPRIGPYRIVGTLGEGSMGSVPDLLTRAAGPQGAERWSMYGVLLTERRRYADAEPHLLSAVEIVTNRLPEGDERTARARARVADVYEAWGRPDEAAAYR